jgi:hypothetical protein
MERQMIQHPFEEMPIRVQSYAKYLKPAQFLGEKFLLPSLFTQIYDKKVSNNVFMWIVVWANNKSERAVVFWYFARAHEHYIISKGLPIIPKQSCHPFEFIRAAPPVKVFLTYIKNAMSSEETFVEIAMLSQIVCTFAFGSREGYLYTLFIRLVVNRF